MILDDDHSGCFTFDTNEMEMVESIGETQIRVARNSGARGRVKVYYRFNDGTAKQGRDYNYEGHELIFENDQTEWVKSVYFITPRKWLF